MSTINTNIENNSVDSKSFAILRTNPKLTSNVKLLVNSIGDLYLSAFKANKELSSIEYQKFEVSPFGKYSYDISKFFRDLATTSIYQTLRLFDDNAVYSSYEFQYEDQYNYGAAFNSTKLYDEQYKIFAPIWLEKKVPSKFVIYRVEDVDYNSNYEENTVGQNSRILELLKKASIVKTFDLGNSSKIGEYLNNHVNEKLFPKSSISINFGEGSMSSFNGIDIVNGGFATKSEQLDKYYTQVDYPEIFSNEIITNGFERNGLISANIINLEFLFDDNVADDYKIYRYFGIYADDIDEGTFMIDNVTNKGEVFIKDNSYATLYDLNDTSLVPFDMIPSGNDFNIPFLRYIKDKEGQYYNLNGSKSIPNYRMLVELNKSKESLFNGFSRNGKKITSESIIPNPRGFYKLTVIDTPSDNDKIFIGDKNEIKISDYNLGDYLIIASSAIPAGRAIKNKFSSVGSFQQIAIAIAQAIKNGEIITYNVYVSGPSITIEDYAAGNNRMQNALGVYNSNLVDFIEVTGGELNSIGLIDSIVPSQEDILPTDYGFLPLNDFEFTDTINNSSYSYFYGGFNGYSDSTNSFASSNLIKINSDLSVDSSFNIGSGIVATVYSTFSITEQLDKKIVVCGLFSSFSGNTVSNIVRINTDGSIDNLFIQGSGFNGYTTKSEIDSLGRIIVTGIFSTYNGNYSNKLIRLTPDGMFDPTFNVGDGFNQITVDVLSNPDNSMFITGYFTAYKGIAVPTGIVKILDNGEIDSSFNGGTGFNVGNFKPILIDRIQGESSFYAFGYFTTYNGVIHNRAIKLQDNGDVDTSFNTGTGFNDDVYSMSIVFDDKLLVTGLYSEYNGIISYGTIVLNRDGTVFFANTVPDSTLVIIGDNVYRQVFGEYMYRVFATDSSFFQDTKFSEWDIYSMVGGSREGQSILVKSSEIGNVNVGEWVKQKNKDNYIQIIEIEKDPIIRDFYRIILNSAVSVSNDNVFEIYDVYKTSHGRFAAYEFKDFDFDFYSTRNSDLGDLSLDVYSHPNKKQTTYAGLNSVLGNELITDEIILENSVNNEYDRLRENSLKETSLRSRIVPTINKFKLKDALNARNLPYILNAYEAFGEDNLSPNIEIDSNRNVEFMNMEHFLINKIPSSLRNNSIENGFDFNNYVDFADDGGLTIQKLKSTDFDYFKSHFNWNGYYNSADQIWHDNTAKVLWSKFNIGNLEKNSSTVFRGLRYEYLKRKENVSEFPTEFINDSNINNYKFGVVLSYYKDRDIDDNIITNNSVNIKSIKNEKFEFICIYITVNVVDNDVSDIDRHLLYTLNDIKLEEEIIDVEIPFWIDFSLNHAEFSNSYPNRHTVIRSSEITPYPAEFTKYITVDENGDFSWIYFEAEGDTYAVKVINVIDDTQITIDGIPWKFNTETGKAEGVRMNVEDIQLIPLTNFKYYRGGKNGFNVLLNEINAYKFANKFNKFKNIEYITIEENGNIINNAYSLSIESGVNIIKPSIVNATSDPDKPRAYQLFSGEIGSIISDRKDGGYLTILRRMNGEYDPLFNSVITFGDGYSFNKVNINSTERNILIYKKFNDLGIAFDSYKNNKEDYGFINNYFYHKVNDENSKNILKLSRTSDKLPIYPLIGEIAIDKKKLNLFKSKYSSNFFTKALPGGFIKLVSGTLSPIEKKNFMASTIMKVKESYDITRYTNKKENTIETLDNIRLNSLNTNSIHWYEDNTRVLMDVYLPFAILQELIEDGIQESFGKYVVPSLSYGNETTLDNDLKVYTNGNIIPRFIIDLIDIYGIKGKDLSTSFVSVDSVDDLNKNGFVQLTNFNILSYQKDGLSFRLIYNKIIGYSYNFKIHVKIQS
jgi:hypothetical protein